MTRDVVLAIEASQRQGSVALQVGDAPVAMIGLENEPVDRALLPAIDRLVREANLEPAALTTLIVSVGPGGFSGLRVSIATVKGLAETRGLPVVPVPSALVAAEAYACVGRLHIALACKRGSWWGTNLIASDGVWEVEGEPALLDAGSFNTDGLTAIVGDEHLPGGVRELGIEVWPLVLDAERCLTVGRRLSGRGCAVDAMGIGPIYPRPPEAVRKWSERQGDPSDGGSGR